MKKSEKICRKKQVPIIGKKLIEVILNSKIWKYRIIMKDERDGYEKMMWYRRWEFDNKKKSVWCCASVAWPAGPVGAYGPVVLDLSSNVPLTQQPTRFLRFLFLLKTWRFLEGCKVVLVLSSFFELPEKIQKDNGTYKSQWFFYIWDMRLTFLEKDKLSA